MSTKNETRDRWARNPEVATESEKALLSMQRLVGRKWNPIILHCLLEDSPMGFNELKDAIDGVSSKVLSDSLDDLEEKGIIDRTVINERPVRVEYSLTEYGESLQQLISAMDERGRAYLAASDEPTPSVGP